MVIDVDADEDDAPRNVSPTSAAPPVDAGIDEHEVDPRWATHNLPGRGCGRQRFHHPTLGAVGRGRGGCSVKCEIVLDRLANVCGGLRRAYEFGYQWHRKPSGDYHQNTRVPESSDTPDAIDATLTPTQVLAARRKEEAQRRRYD